MVQPLELPFGGSEVTAVQVGTDERQMGVLVGRLLGQQVLPATRVAEQSEVRRAQLAARRLRPALVGILGQQRSGVRLDGGRQHLRIPEGPGTPRQALEHVDVEVDLVVRQECHEIVPQQDGTVVVERTPCVVSDLVQPWAGLADGDPGPERVDHLLAMEATAGCEREQLDERRDLAPGPPVRGHGRAVDHDLEAPEQLDPCAPHGRSFPRGHATDVPGTSSPVSVSCSGARQEGRCARWSTSSLMEALTARIRVRARAASQP